MRALSAYSPAEWLTGAPLAHRVRRVRNLLVDRIYRDRKAEGQEALVARLKEEAAPLVAFTVAFNMPEAIRLLADAMARFLPGTTLVVCDNSSDPAARAAIAALSAGRGLAYCALPPSPYRGGRNGSRSHAVALNWIWANLVRPLAPPAFALLDHDLVPLAPTDLAALVENQPCYGMARHGRDRETWYLWPGFSVFRFDAVVCLPLDFGTDTPLALDTGGQNWTVLYRTLDPSRLAFARIRSVFIPDTDGGHPQSHLLADGWLHAGGAGHAGHDAFGNVARAYAADPQGLLADLEAGRWAPQEGRRP